MLLLGGILLLPLAVVGHNKMTKKSGANTVRGPPIPSKCARDMLSTLI